MLMAHIVYDVITVSKVCSVVLAYDDVINGERWTLTTQDRCGHLTIEVAA